MINNLKAAVEKQPELLAVVNTLEKDQAHLAKLIFDLARLDEALIQRIIMFEGLKHAPGAVGAVADNCQNLLITIRSFIGVITTTPEEKAKSASEVFNDLMKRM